MNLSLDARHLRALLGTQPLQLRSAMQGSPLGQFFLVASNAEHGRQATVSEKTGCRLYPWLAANRVQRRSESRVSFMVSPASAESTEICSSFVTCNRHCSLLSPC